MTKHEYPSDYPPGIHWAIDAAWEILDHLPPGALTIEQRSFIAGMFSGRLMKERADTDEVTALFDRQWEADQRAIKRWQAAHPGKENVWPDRADMVLWLMEEKTG